MAKSAVRASICVVAIRTFVTTFRFEEIATIDAILGMEHPIGIKKRLREITARRKVTVARIEAEIGVITILGILAIECSSRNSAEQFSKLIKKRFMVIHWSTKAQRIPLITEPHRSLVDRKRRIRWKGR